MSKKTQQMNFSCVRINFWNSIKLRLDSFARIIDVQPYLTSEDRVNLREIRHMLYLCRNMAEYRESFHKNKFKEAFKA